MHRIFYRLIYSMLIAKYSQCAIRALLISREILPGVLPSAVRNCLIEWKQSCNALVCFMIIDNPCAMQVSYKETVAKGYSLQENVLR